MMRLSLASAAVVCLLGLCVASATAVPATPATADVSSSTDDLFLANWFEQLLPAIGGQTLLDLSLPGTHDTMTYDLSDTVSDSANDLPAWASWLLHEFKDFAGIAKFIHNQAKTQGLNITAQLDNGVRFLDFRVVYTAGPDSGSTDPHDWYCLHMVESNHKALTYLQEVHAWMVAHPKELVVLWISRHGSPCSTEYPDITPQEMQTFFGQITSLFDGLIFNSSQSQMNTTTVQELIDSNNRLVMYVSDYKNFTDGGTPLAMDGCMIDNRLGNDVSSEQTNVKQLIADFQAAPGVIAADKAENRFYLRSLAGGAPSKQQEYAALLTFLPFIGKSENTKKCAAAFNIPGMDDWCPMYLQDIGQLSNYYSQIALDAVITQGLGLPNAIYLDAFDVGGTIRTGNALFPSSSPPVPGKHNSTGFAYVDTLLLWNVRQACAKTPAPAACASLETMLEERRAHYPLARWDDPHYGRLEAWPNATLAL